MKSKRLIITIILCVCLIITFVMLTSYALWKVKDTQSGSNLVVGACLRLVLEEEKDENNKIIGGFTLEDAWPISDEEGMHTKGYTFTLENTCSKRVNYQVVLESLEIDNKNQNDYLDNEYVKIKFDNQDIVRFSELSEADNDLSSSYAEDLRETKLLYTGMIQGQTEAIVQNKETHNIKIWIADDAENDQMGKAFKSKIRIYAGQGIPDPEYAITPESCFDFDNNTGTILGYHEQECTTDYLVLPTTINDTIIKKIDYNFSNLADKQINWEYIDLTRAKGLQEIGQSVFYNYVGEGKQLVIPDSVTDIGEYSFYSYVGEGKELIIPDNVTGIYQNAFYSFNGSNLVLGNQLNTIGLYAFSQYKGEGQSLYIPGSVFVIGALSFENFNGSELILGEGVQSIGGSAFLKYDGLGKELIIPNSVGAIEGSAFLNFRGDKLTLGNNIFRLGLRSFYKYQGEKFTIPSTITTLSEDAFHDYTGIIDIDMSQPEFNSKISSTNWKNEQATLNFLQ